MVIKELSLEENPLEILTSMFKCEGLGKITLLAMGKWSFQKVGTVYRQ